MDVERDIKPVPDTTSSSPTADVKHDSPLEIYIDPVKERKILTKFDWLVMPQFVIIILLGYLDRSNIGNARIFGFGMSSFASLKQQTLRRKSDLGKRDTCLGNSSRLPLSLNKAFPLLCKPT
jgi:hypothetical protein